MRAKTPAEWYETLAWLYGGYKQHAASDNRAAA